MTTDAAIAAGAAILIVVTVCLALTRYALMRGLAAWARANEGAEQDLGD